MEEAPPYIVDPLANLCDRDRDTLARFVSLFGMGTIEELLRQGGELEQRKMLDQRQRHGIVSIDFLDGKPYSVSVAAAFVRPPRMHSPFE